MSADIAPDLARWNDAVLAAALMSLAPHNIGGIVVKAQCGPVRDAWFALLTGWLSHTAKLRKIPIDVTEGRLIGGMDLAATLSRGQPVAERGLLADADGGLIVVPCAERAAKSAITAIASALDAGQVMVERDGITAVNAARFGVIAFDESRADEDAVATLLRDRLAIQIDLDAIRVRDAVALPITRESLEQARGSLEFISIRDEDIEALCVTAAALGIASLRAPLQALHIARASAALSGRQALDADDLEAAVRLVLVPRATRFPAEPDAQNEVQPAPETTENAQQPDTPDGDPTAEELEAMLLAAAKAMLPPGLLDSLRQSASARKAKSAAGRAGQVKVSQKNHGRRAGSRRGDPRAGGSLDLLETVRAAAPWQPMRRAERLKRASSIAPAPRLEVRRDDFRLRRFKQHSETATIFVVDASGSAALHRLAEAKGAVELLLADCYARRDHVALIAFRGKTAELLLPPTRSLVRAKRSLAGLPGGGGTPLATATDQACELGKVTRRKGQAATLVFLTDGRANINRTGAAGRAAAQSDAHAAAQTLKAEGLSAIVIDTSSHPSEESKRFADVMGATYLPLPYADAASLSVAIRNVAS